MLTVNVYEGITLNTRIELKEFNDLRHRVAACVRSLEAIPALPAMGAEALEGLKLMIADGRGIKDVFDAASREREVPMPFVAEVDNWVARADAVIVSIDLSE
jgi:hypothetical protein